LLRVGSIPEDYRSILAIILSTRKGKEHERVGIKQIDKTPPQATQTLRADSEQEPSCYRDESELDPSY
jgi:hypothetical protein